MGSASQTSRVFVPLKVTSYWSALKPFTVTPEATFLYSAGTAGPPNIPWRSELSFMLSRIICLRAGVRSLRSITLLVAAACCEAAEAPAGISDQVLCDGSRIWKLPFAEW